MSNAADRLLGVLDGRAAGASSNSASGLSFGTVTSTSPLTITRDDGHPFSGNMLVLSKTCRALSVEIQGETVQLWPELSAGESVVMLSFNNKQSYFIERR